MGASSDRYSRQTILREVGREGQEKISRARILCVGVGGLGSPALLYLAAAGVAHLTLIDPDRVDESNLQRQVLFTEGEKGELKVKAARERLMALNSRLELRLHSERLNAANALETARGHDLMLDGTDNFSAKFLINDLAARLGIPWVYGSISGFEGQVAALSARDGACYRCLFPEAPRTWIPNCAEAGVLGAVAGVVGSMQALEALKLVLGRKDSLGKLTVWDGLSMRSRSLKIPKREGCPACSPERLAKPESITLSDLPELCAKADEGETLTPERLSTLLRDPRQKVTIFDVREEEEWRHEHLPGATHWPLSRLLRGEFPEPRNSLNPMGTEQVLLYCQSGIRSARALSLFRAHPEWQRARLTHLEGGMNSLLSAAS